MKVDQSREQFEELMLDRYDTRLLKHDNGDYKSKILQNNWSIWQASRSAIEIQLPERLEPTGYHIDEAYMVPDKDGEYMDRDAVIEALTENGLTVKES